MLRTSVQTAINVVVIVLLVGAVVFGAIALIPSRNPAGPLIGKLLSVKGNLSGLLANLDPAKLAEAMRENPEMTLDLLAELGEDGARTRTPPSSPPCSPPWTPPPWPTP